MTSLVLALGIFCLAFAVVYLIKWSKPRADRPGPARTTAAHIILRWFHPAVWFLLALACFLWAFGFSTLANGAAVLGLFCYFLFLFTLIADRKAGRPAGKMDKLDKG